jgi:hypothetical protein
MERSSGTASEVALVGSTPSVRVAGCAGGEGRLGPPHDLTSATSEAVPDEAEVLSC